MTRLRRVWVDLVSRSPRSYWLHVLRRIVGRLEPTSAEEGAIKQIKAAYESGINVSPMCSFRTVTSAILTYCMLHQTYDTDCQVDHSYFVLSHPGGLIRINTFRYRPICQLLNVVPDVLFPQPRSGCPG